MNYIEQINVFWRLDAEHSFNGNETRLYFYLLDLSNSLYWKNPLTNADGYTATVVGISVNTLKTVRNRLQQAGLISFKPGGNGAKNKCQYTIIPAVQVLRSNAGKVSNSDTLSEETLTPYLIPGIEKTDDISKQKPNQTKLTVTPDKKSRKKGMVEEEFFDHMRSIWFEFNVSLFLKKNPGADPKAGEPSWEGTGNPKILNKIVGRLRQRSIYQKIEWQLDTAVITLTDFLTRAATDKWINDNFLLSNLDKQFDKIILNKPKHEADRKNIGKAAAVNGSAKSAGAHKLLEHLREESTSA